MPSARALTSSVVRNWSADAFRPGADQLRREKLVNCILGFLDRYAAHGGDGLRDEIQLADIHKEQRWANGCAELLPAQYRKLLAQAIAPFALQSHQIERVRDVVRLKTRRNPQVRHTAQETAVA